MYNILLKRFREFLWSLKKLKPAFLSLCLLLISITNNLQAQSFGQSSLDFNGNGGVSQGTSLMFGPDGRLYVLGLNGTIDIFTVQRDGQDDYVVTDSEELLDVKNIPNHNDDGSSNAGNNREATGITVAGTPTNPIIYVTSSDSQIGGPGGDKDLDTNSGVITRLSWNGATWVVTDLVRGLPRSEENHATNGLEFITVGGIDYLIVCSGGHTNAGSPSDNFAWTTEYALSAAILSVNLTMLESMPINNDGGRQYIYDLPTLDDPTRDNVNGIIDPDDAGYTGIDLNDPWGGNDGLNQAMLVQGGPVQMFSPGYRNTYDLVITASGAVYATDNGANSGWGGLPAGEGTANVTNDYVSSEPGSTGGNPLGGESVDNEDHLTLITSNIQSYTFGSFYGGHPAPVRANPIGAGLFTNPEENNYNPLTSVFRTLTYDPDGSTPNSTTDPNIALPANWPPVSVALANGVESDWRAPTGGNPDGPDDVNILTWQNNTNGIDEYTASNFGGAMQGDLIAGSNKNALRRVQLDGSGGVDQYTQAFLSNLGGNSLGITCNSDSDPFPGTIWVATFNSTIKVFEPQDFIECILPGESGYSAAADNDSDGYTNQDEIDNKLLSQSDEDVICNGGNQPNDFDKEAGGPLVSDLNDDDDDADGILDQNDPFQLGDPLNSGSDAFNLPVLNELLSDNPTLKGYLGLGFTGLMNNGAANPNYLDWLDKPGPNQNDILGGAVGAMTMQMTAGTALGNTNSQEKAFQYGVNVDQNTNAFTVSGRLFNFASELQLYGSAAPTNGELGLFIGDGTQSNYIKFVITPSGLQALQEINDNPQTPVTFNIPTGNRPTNDIVMFFNVNAVTGVVTLQYTFDGGSVQTLGTITAQGTILNAIQNSNTPLAVGLIGTSNDGTKELEGTWDFLNVESTQPTIQQALPDVAELINAPDQDIDLNDFFDDDNGDGNLTFTVESNTATGVGANISGNTLTLSFPATPDNGVITVRATDNSTLFIEQTFSVTVSDEPVPIIRIQANGTGITATDAPNPDWVGVSGTGAQSGTFNGISYAVGASQTSTQNVLGRDATLPAYVPQSLFTTERYGAMAWTFDLPNDDYFVRVYMGNGFNGTSTVGTRVFDITIEGQLVKDNLDLITEFGDDEGGMLEFQVTLTDGTLNIDFGPEVENPLVNGFEILSVGSVSNPPITVNAIPDQSSLEGDVANITILASGGDTNENFSFSGSNLPPGIQVEPTTGLIFGTISAGANTGSPYTSSITVDKPSSSSVTVNFNWTVTAPGGEVWNDQTDDENYTARHECSFVQVGDKFYLFGGRENSTTLDVYDYQAKTWSSIANSAPKEFNHFQAVEYQGLIWVIGAFQTNAFPNEVPADFIWAYDPANDEWIQGPEIPASRKRGSAGLVMYNDKFYVIAGNDDGHDGGFVKQFDEFDPATGTWTTLADAPRERDHFHAAVIGNKLYVAGGRLSGGTGGTFAPLIPEVDVYDFGTSTWTTLPSVDNIPTPRAAASVATFQGELFVIGGEIQGTVNDAVNITEAYDPVSGNWSTKASLLTERHGTQAIASGGGIHVVAGSSSLGGGGTMKNMEFFGTDNPSGTAVVASQLSAPTTATVNSGGFETITVNNSGGNTGIIITGLSLTGANAVEFNLGTTSDFILVKSGESTDLLVSFTGSAAGQTANLEIDYGNGSTATVVLTSAVGQAGAVLFRVNTGGALTPTNDAEAVDWSEDQASTTANGSAATGTPSQYLNLTAPAVDLTFGVANFTGTNNTGYPNNLFTTERYSNIPNPDNMQWDFPVANGDYTVNLIFAEVWTGAQTPGTRVFDVEIEGNLVLDDFDQTVAYGWNTAGVESIPVTVTDGNLDIDFLTGVQNPNIKAIEIRAGGAVANNPPVVTNPGPQFGVEGGNVLVQIDAIDDNDCGSMTYSATGLPPSLTIDPSTGLISGTIDEGSAGTAGSFIEAGGIVLIEAETDFTETAGGWNLETGTPTFLVASTNTFGNATGGQVLDYNVQITTPGVYRFHMKSEFSGTNATEENDTWFKIDNTPDVHFFAVQGGALTGTQQFLDELADETNTTKTLFYPAGNAEGRTDHGNENPGNKGYFKVYRSGGGGNKWDAKTIDNNGWPIYAYFPNAGNYTINMGERSGGHKVDRFGLIHIDDVSTGIPTSTLDGAESQQTTGGTAGASANSPYNVVVTVTDDCVPPLAANTAFTWDVLAVQGNAEAVVKVTSGADIATSTFGNNSFQIENTGDVDITNITINTVSGFMMDVVFDPVGTAGDNGAKCLTEGTASVGDVGITVPADGGSDNADCVSVFAQPHNGIDDDEGYDEMTLDFTDFNPGELFAFGVDMDPTTIKGDLSTGDAGSISGFELIGATVTITFVDGSIYTTSLFDEGSIGGSDAIVNDLADNLTAPSIDVGGSALNQVVSQASQTINITGGPANGSVTLLRVDGRLHIDPGNPGIGYDIDPFEANEIMTKELYPVTLDGSGAASVPVTLTITPGTGGQPDGGLNHFIAVTTSPSGENSLGSNVIVLEYDPNATGADLAITITSQGRVNNDHSGEHLVECYALTDLVTPAYTFTPTANAAGEMTVTGIATGTYKVKVSRTGFLQRVQEITFTTGTEAATFPELRAGNLNTDNVVNILDFSVLANQFGQASQISDLNGDGVTNILDFSLLASNFGQSGDPLN